MLFKKLLGLIFFVLISVAAVLGAQELLAEYPRLQAAATWSAATMAATLFLYFLCRGTKFSELGLEILRKLFFPLLFIIFLVWLLNFIFKALNLISIIGKLDWRIGNIFNEPYMSVAFSAGIVLGFVILLINYWADDLGQSIRISPEREI